ncbi:MAG: hypothetical protein JWL80_436 [Parcubacteria group bacterium]|nr:hypothetical protein [Parcubacteria group bacterium]
MSKQNVEKMLKSELESLNTRIDQKIIKGLSYARDAKQHKYLLARIAQIRKASRPAFFQKFSFVPTLFF